jgi:integrase
LDGQKNLAFARRHAVRPQIEAFYHLALDTGARRVELRGLGWQDVDLTIGQIFIVPQQKRLRHGFRHKITGLIQTKCLWL